MKWMNPLLFILYIIACVLTWNRIIIGVVFTFLLRTVMSVPVCLFMTLVVHELTHLILFRCFGVRVTEVKIGLITVDLRQKKRTVKFFAPKFFSGYCSIVYPEGDRKKGAIIGFAGGGISGAFESLLSFCMLLKLSPQNSVAPFLCCLIIIGIYSFYTTLLRRTSADCQAIQELIRGDG